METTRWTTVLCEMVPIYIYLILWTVKVGLVEIGGDRHADQPNGFRRLMGFPLWLEEYYNSLGALDWRQDGV